MYLRRIHISTILLACFMLTAPWSSALAQDEQKSNNRNSQSLSAFGAGGSSPNNDIYIDDEGLEGSGSRGEIRDDLEKEDDESSGSGYGDDDEDSSARGSSRSNSNTGISSNVGHGGGSSKGDSDRGGSSSSGGASGSIGGGGGGAGSGDHELDGREDDDEEDDLYTETNKPSIDLGPTDDEDMPIDTSKSGGSVTHERGGHGPDGTDPDVYTPRVPASEGGHDSNNAYGGSGVLIMNAKNEDRTASFFAQPGILAAVIGGAVVGLLCAILVVMFIVYRMRKKDEGSYALDEPKRSPTANTYAKNANNREFYA